MAKFFKRFLDFKEGIFTVLLMCISFNSWSAATDDCVTTASQLDGGAQDFGTKVTASKRELNGLIDDCEKALQLTPNSATLRLNLAKALIWSEREIAALIQLETLLTTDKEYDVYDLSHALCALNKGGPAVTSQVCDWSAEVGMSDPQLARLAADNKFNSNQPEMALDFTTQAAMSGADEALQYLNKICDNFDPQSSAYFSSLDRKLVSLDPLYVAATACEAAYLNASTDTPEWVDYGFKYAEAMLYFDDFEATAGTLLELSQSSDNAVVGRTIDTLDSLCTATAGDMNDPEYGSDGVSDFDLISDRAQPVCEAAAYVWPDNGRLHYNLARIYGQMGPAEESSLDAALDEAERLGYPLAVQLARKKPMPFNYADFANPSYIKALYEKDIAFLNQEPVYSLNYAMALHQLFSDQSILFLTDSASEILLLIDPSLEHKATRKLTSGPAFNDAVNKGMQSFWGPLMAMAEARRSGASIQQEVQSSLNAISQSPTVRIDLLKKQAQQDGRRLIILWDTNPDDFKKVYEGIKFFINS